MNVVPRLIEGGKSRRDRRQCEIRYHMRCPSSLLVPLRNFSIIGHGYRGASEEIIIQEYNSDPSDQLLSPVEDMAIICAALDISTVNPFRNARDLIRNLIVLNLGEVHTV